MMNIIWPAFIIVSFVYALLTGRVNEINNGSIKPTFTFNSVKDLYYALNK